MVVVANVVGTDARTCPCGTWLVHWARGAGRSASRCCVLPCLEAAEVGAHVREIDRDAGLRGIEYILPMCQSHNRQAGPLFLAADALLVPAGLQPFCRGQ